MTLFRSRDSIGSGRIHPSIRCRFDLRLDCLDHLVAQPLCVLQEEEADGDRHHIDRIEALQKLAELENSTGIYFRHIRLLAKALTRRSVGYNFLTRYYVYVVSR